LERFGKRRADFEAKNARIAAISVDPIDVAQKLYDRLELGFPLLSDEGGAVARAYGVYHTEKKIALPAIIVVDSSGVVRWRRISGSVTDRPEEDEVLDVVDRLPHASR
jgi:thioredoxin-dependent peroxiredoxin